MELLNCFIEIISKKVENDITKLRKIEIAYPYISFGTSDEVILFRDVLKKELLDSDDINDLLICYSDHIMSDDELLNLVLNNKYILYEMDEVTLNVDVRNLIIKYLLCTNNKEIILEILKLYGTALIGDETNEKSLYDVYLLINDILNETNFNKKQERIILFMMNYDIKYFLLIFKEFNLDYSCIEKFIKNTENNGTRFTSDSILLLLNNKLAIENKYLGDSSLVSKVKNEYEKYSSSHITFNLIDFIKYYNMMFNDNFSAFYYNKPNSKLDVELLISILARNDEDKDNIMIYGEYLGTFKSLNNLNCEWQEWLTRYIKNKINNDYHTKKVIDKYANQIERLKDNINITLEYYIYLNVLDEDREAFYNVLKWFYTNDKNYFGRNIFLSTVEQKDETFKLIVSSYKERIFTDFGKRKEIHKYYFDFIRKMTNWRYISLSKWNEYLDNVTLEYYAKEGLIHINEMVKLLENGDELLLYQEENFEYSEFKQMCLALCTLYPELESVVSLVKDKLYDEISTKVIDKRLLVDKMIVEKHSEVIRAFIASECKSKLHFLTLAKIDDLRFDRAISVVRKYNHPLYEEYRKKMLDCYNIGYHPLEKVKKNKN